MLGKCLEPRALRVAALPFSPHSTLHTPDRSSCPSFASGDITGSCTECKLLVNESRSSSRNAPNLLFPRAAFFPREFLHDVSSTASAIERHLPWLASLPTGLLWPGCHHHWSQWHLRTLHAESLVRGSQAMEENHLLEPQTSAHTWRPAGSCGTHITRLPE